MAMITGIAQIVARYIALPSSRTFLAMTPRGVHSLNFQFGLPLITAASPRSSLLPRR
jgi:hypothetical protein